MKWIAIPITYLKNKSTIQLVTVANRKICLVYHQDRWFAFQPKCPHAGAPLVQGYCEGSDIVCPYHRHRFDLKTGRGAIGQGNYIRIYPIKNENGEYYIGMQPTFWDKLF